VKPSRKKEIFTAARPYVRPRNQMICLTQACCTIRDATAEKHVESEALTALTMKGTIFLDVTPSSLIDSDRFPAGVRDNCLLHNVPTQPPIQ
jgi:hypothetical protein